MSKGLFSIEGKTALVTGGSRGIGLMIARGFVEAGATVIVSSRRADVCERVAAELSEIGPCSAVPADLAQPDEAVRLAAAVTAAHDGRLEILVNNAGAVWGAPIDSFPMSGWDKVLAVNVKAVFALTQALLPALRAAARPGDPARVINIGSVDGIRVPGSMPWDEETYSYSASKAAVHHLTKTLARRLGPDGITVNAIAPGPFETKMMQATMDRHAESMREASPLGRTGEPDDMAGTAIYLASRAGAYLTGTVIPVDGGISTTR